jgi:dipeptidyl aminopeptidase/acylaminoacyl peptidase
MNESMDRTLAEWLHEGPETGPREGLERALAATRRAGQRPGWTLPERWLPMQLAMARVPSRRLVAMLALLALLVLAVTAAAVFVGSIRDHPLPPRQIGAVVYPHDGDLFIVDRLDGTPRSLGAGPGAYLPAFSPLGDRIAFVKGDLGRERHVVAVRPDGSGAELLANLPGWYGTHLSWAPDGRALAASTDGISANGAAGTGPSAWQLAIVAADGSGFRTVEAGPGTWAGRADWRPDGRQIAFVSWTKASGTRDVFLADPDGTNVRRLAGAGNVASNSVAWSPDGSRLAFLHYREDRTVEIIVIEADADGRVTRSIAIPPHPAIGDASEAGPPVEVAGVTPGWSPDGRQLAYGLIRDSTLGVGIVGADGSGSRAIEALVSAGTTDLDWTPDGRSLVVIREGRRDGDQDAWLLDLTTGEETEADELAGDWLTVAP